MIYPKVKRLIDFVLSFLGCIILAPLMIILCIAIKIESPGKVLFKQKRIGIHKKTFNILKFRTMRIDTPKDMPTHMLTNPDQYITKVGRFLRKSSLDELPQIYNILAGQMSIIGPRPLMVRYLSYYTDEERKRHSVRPGLSGYAQVHGRNNVDWAERMKMDVYYADHVSFKMDLKILFETILIVIKREGISVEDMTNFDDFRKKQWEDQKREKGKFSEI